jgi:hypothetical protein
MPATYGGCEANGNRFSTPEECYAVCGGQGDVDSAACDSSADCTTQRLAEPCCSLSVREFVGIHQGVTIPCDDPKLGCTLCAADCDYRPEDGFIGASCVEGHCIAYDARDYGAARGCDAEEGCRLTYGLDCCKSSCEESKLIAIEENFDLLCDDSGPCQVSPPSCDFSGATAECVDGTCVVRPLQ